MTLLRPLILAASILALAAAVWFGMPRYTLTQLGNGTLLRLNTRTGDILRCAPNDPDTPYFIIVCLL